MSVLIFGECILTAAGVTLTSAVRRMKKEACYKGVCGFDFTQEMEFEWGRFIPHCNPSESVKAERHPSEYKLTRTLEVRGYCSFGDMTFQHCSASSSSLRSSWHTWRIDLGPRTFLRQRSPASFEGSSLQFRWGYCHEGHHCSEVPTIFDLLCHEKASR